MGVCVLASLEHFLFVEVGWGILAWLEFLFIALLVFQKLVLLWSLFLLFLGATFSRTRGFVVLLLGFLLVFGSLMERGLSGMILGGVLKIL